MGRSWLDDEMTEREYRLADGTRWVVQNEYRPLKCPQCDKEQFCRLTHIWHYDNQDRCTPEYHVNFNTDLASLKELLVTYINGNPVCEVENEGKWLLMMGKEKIGEERM